MDNWIEDFDNFVYYKMALTPVGVDILKTEVRRLLSRQKEELEAKHKQEIKEAVDKALYFGTEVFESERHKKGVSELYARYGLSENGGDDGQE